MSPFACSEPLAFFVRPCVIHTENVIVARQQMQPTISSGLFPHMDWQAAVLGRKRCRGVQDGATETRGSFLS